MRIGKKDPQNLNAGGIITFGGIYNLRGESRLSHPFCFNSEIVITVCSARHLIYMFLSNGLSKRIKWLTKIVYSLSKVELFERRAT